MFRASNFDKLLDKATSNLRLEPDWPTIIQICDLIRQNDVVPKYAVAAIKKKLYSQNPHQAMFALLTLESIVKNCGSGVHDEVASKAFCEMLRDLVKTTQHENLRTKILELIQAWAFAFRNTPKYRAVQDTVNILKAESYKFPPLKESDAMFSADTAPEWADGEVCHRCRVAFSLMVRRHHCRACGQVFCQQCSSKTSTLPKFGIEKEVRVCDACYDKVSRPPSSTTKLDVVNPSSEHGQTQPQKKPGKTAEELQEEEELQLALALSQSEAEQKEKQRKSLSRSHIAPDPLPQHSTVSPTPSSVSASPDHSGQTNPELSRYLDRGYWEQRSSREQPSTAPTAPAPTPASQPTHTAVEETFVKPVSNKAQEDDAEDKEIDEFVETLKSQVEIFVNRMKSNSSRGRSIANDTSVQTLFMNITAMHSRLLRYIQQQDDKRVYLESLQDKVNQVRDSRAALDTLRAEHAARLAAAQEAAERQKQMQMAAKLQAMRKKKHEYLQYQRQLALQRVQEQEREMQMRQEQQKHQYMMSANNAYYLPGVPLNQFQSGFPSQPIYANSQFHPQMIPHSATEGPMSMTGQPQLSQGMGSNQIGTMSQPMPQIPNTFSMSTSGMTVSQAPATTQSMMQPNIRQTMGQQVPIQQQMMMQQMQQMRMSGQPGMHQMIPQGVNGITGQQTLHLGGQQTGQHVQKQNLPNQPQPQPGSVMTSLNQNVPQYMNPMMQMQNMRMLPMQGQMNNNQSTVVPSQYPISIQNHPNMQSNPNMPHPQIPAQLTSGQQITHGQTQNIHLSNNIPNNQNASSQGQTPQPYGSSQAMAIATQGQAMPLPGHQVSSQGQNIGQTQTLMKQGQVIGFPTGHTGQMGQNQQMQNPTGSHVGSNQQMQNPGGHHNMNVGLNQQMQNPTGPHSMNVGPNQQVQNLTGPHSMNVGPNQQLQNPTGPHSMNVGPNQQMQNPTGHHSMNVAPNQQMQNPTGHHSMNVAPNQQMQNPTGHHSMNVGLNQQMQHQMPQNMNLQGQQMSQNQQMAPSQHLNHLQQMQQNQVPPVQMLPQGSQVASGAQNQGQHAPQNQQSLQNQTSLGQQQMPVNKVQTQLGPPQSVTNSQTQGPAGGENNNTTSELISFD